MNPQHLTNSINEASRAIGKTWPLYSFVTSNPLSGYEQSSFGDALEKAGKLLKANILPDVSLFKQAWDNGEIDNDALIHALAENGFFESPELCLELFENHSKKEITNENHEIDLIMAKWLSAFMDEGLAEWQMPGKKKGFYKAWRDLARYDGDLNVNRLSDIPETSEQAIEQSLQGFSKEEYTKIFMNHLAALPGWTGYIKHRVDAKTSWQQNFPISLQDYLGVRLWIARHLNLQILPMEPVSSGNKRIIEIQLIWLRTWEQTWQGSLLNTLQKPNRTTAAKQKKMPDAQLVFCIDTRSELIRRHVEAAGNYETYGYAGFFGIAMDYVNVKDGMIRKSCPPIVGSAYRVSEIPQKSKEIHALELQKKNEISGFRDYFLSRMKNMLPSAFGYVEGTGILYGASILARTLTPGYLYRKNDTKRFQQEKFCETDMIKKATNREVQMISLQEKAGIVKSAFDLMGWKDFAPLVVFTGHGSHTANNAFGSSLDCGACAASPGRNNARMIAKLANLKEVRELLALEYNISIPNNTVFVGAEHNTTTDEIEIFDAQVPDSHHRMVKNLKADLRNARETATLERLGTRDSIKLSEVKANNWSETRPEWGLAKNAGFIVGPRELTENANLDSRCFLHSYNWESDKEGAALEGIMQGPMVVTQWINNHYYFSSVDNEVFGGDSKITHNITGRFGVVKGNGGDLKMGLPLQSLNKTDTEMYHQPLRLSVVIQAPEDRISDILLRNENLKQLLDNEWIYLLVMDPTEDNRVKRYIGDMVWQPLSEEMADTNKEFKSEMALVN